MLRGIKSRLGCYMFSKGRDTTVTGDSTITGLSLGSLLEHHWLQDSR